MTSNIFDIKNSPRFEFTMEFGFDNTIFKVMFSFWIVWLYNGDMIKLRYDKYMLPLKHTIHVVYGWHFFICQVLTN